MNWLLKEQGTISSRYALHRISCVWYISSHGPFRNQYLRVECYLFLINYCVAEIQAYSDPRKLVNISSNGIRSMLSTKVNLWFSIKMLWNSCVISKIRRQAQMYMTSTNDHTHHNTYTNSVLNDILNQNDYAKFCSVKSMCIIKCITINWLKTTRSKISMA